LANAKTAVGSGLGLIQGTLWRSLALRNKWGVFDSKGKALADPAKFQAVREAVGIPFTQTLSFSSLDYSKDMATSDFPVERGSFASYNKVEKPAEPTVNLNFEGSESDRKKFLSNLDAATKSVGLYSVVTPEVSYIDYSIDRYSYKRESSNGVTLLKVTLNLKEIRQVSEQYTNRQISAVKNPTSSDATNNGKVQPIKTTKSTLKALTTKAQSFLPKLSDYIKTIGK
jgi:hypothetical protein